MEPKDYSLTKVPPQNLEAEQSVLGAMLLDNSVILEAQRLLPVNYFYADGHRKIYAAMLDVFGREKRVDLVLLINALREKNQIESVGGSSYLASLADNTISALLLPNHAAVLKQKAILRQLIGGFSELANLAYDGQFPLEDLLGQAQNLVADLSKQSVDGVQAKKLGMPLKQILDYFADCRETPWPSLNDAIGGFSSGDLIVTGGLPGVGKSTFAHALMRYIAIIEGRPVAYFGPQMSPQKVYRRQLAAMCHLPEKDIRGGRILEDSQLEMLEIASQKINAAEIYREIVGEEISAFSLMAHVRKFTDQAKRPMGLVIVENLQQITMPGKKTNKEAKDSVLNALRAFGADEMKIPIDISCQLNEPTEGEKGRRPTLGDLRSTGNTQEIADKIFLLHRPGYHPNDGVKKEFEPGEVIIAKGGPAMVLPFTFVGSCFDWEERHEP